MKCRTHFLHIQTRGWTHVVNITDDVQRLITDEHMDSGFVLLFVQGSTAALSTIEYEPGLTEHDLPELLESLIPYRKAYRHHEMWHDDNGAAHLRATIMGPSLQIPFSSGKLLTGTWQQIVLIDFDTRPRKRTVIVQIWGTSHSS